MVVAWVDVLAGLTLGFGSGWLLCEWRMEKHWTEALQSERKRSEYDLSLEREINRNLLDRLLAAVGARAVTAGGVAEERLQEQHASETLRQVREMFAPAMDGKDIGEQQG